MKKKVSVASRLRKKNKDLETRLNQMDAHIRDMGRRLDAGLEYLNSDYAEFKKVIIMLKDLYSPADPVMFIGGNPFHVLPKTAEFPTGRKVPYDVERRLKVMNDLFSELGAMRTQAWKDCTFRQDSETAQRAKDATEARNAELRKKVEENDND